ncbi:MAG: hypothetical protein KDD19_15715 [Phaeodactylibacter sp.]|nr:hypothetical protein [Phaeodactylibacter sp.]MCB9050922.1 hypothetical protein [Lewinellaceae bacterium]
MRPLSKGGKCDFSLFDGWFLILIISGLMSFFVEGLVEKGMIFGRQLSWKLLFRRDRAEAWLYSSAREYAGLRKRKLCNLPLATELLDL